MSHTQYYIIIFIMVLFSAYFSASEIAFNASNKLRLKKSAESGSRTAKLAYKISEDFTSALSAILIGNNLANIAASTAATVIAMTILLEDFNSTNEGLASVISTVVMTLIILIFGEIIPKILGRKNADKLVKIFAYPTYFLLLILYPLVKIVMLLVHFLSRLWGKDADDNPSITEDELSSIIETVEEEGVIDEEKSELLQSTLDFHDTTVEEIMTPRTEMISFDITDDWKEIKEVIASSKYSRLPVSENNIDNIIGVLSLNQYYRTKVKKNRELNEKDLRQLLLKPLYVHKTLKLQPALTMMQEKKMHLAIVIDEFGGTMGIVTMEDILEELVGDIWDENDEIISEFRKTTENTYEVDGEMNIDDFFAEIEFEPDDFTSEYTTMGGLAIERLDADPHVGDTFSLNDRRHDEDGEEIEDEEPYTELNIAVTEMDEMLVTKLMVLINHKNQPEEEKKD